MNKQEEELLNKYFDGDLSESDSLEIKILTNENPEFAERLIAQNAIETALKKSTPVKAPDKFTSKVMRKINSTDLKLIQESSKFFKSMIIIFSLLIISSLIYGYSLASPNGTAGIFTIPEFFPKFSAHSITKSIESIFNPKPAQITSLSIMLLLFSVLTVYLNSFFKFKKNIK